MQYYRGILVGKVIETSSDLLEHSYSGQPKEFVKIVKQQEMPELPSGFVAVEQHVVVQPVVQAPVVQPIVEQTKKQQQQNKKQQQQNKKQEPDGSSGQPA